MTTEIEELCPKCGNETTIEQTDYFITVACEKCLEHFKIIDYDDCCKSPNLQTVRFVDGAGKNHVRNQCQSCGTIKSNSVGGYSAHEKTMLPLADKNRNEETQERRYSLRTQLYERYRDRLNRRQFQKETLWWKAYKAYLETPKWREKSMLVLERENYLCQACRKRRATQAHHLTYEFLGHEPLFQLVAVCKPCHEHLHKIRNAKRSC
jgi:hypothetical protein